MSKIGQFDWIMEYDDLKDILFNELKEYLKIHSLDSIRVLDVGCGTSQLPVALLKSGFGEVVAIDNDFGCIQHMSGLSELKERLLWLQHDILEEPSETNYSELSDERFDIIIDKATLDYMLAEGPVADMLCNVHRMLKRDGAIYVICSAHNENFLVPFFQMPALGFLVTSYKVSRTVAGALLPTLGTVIVCKKLPNSPLLVDQRALADQERKAMDDFFQEVKPLLSLQQIEELRGAFPQDCCLPLEEAHKVMFGAHEVLSYSFAMFLEDLGGFTLSLDGHISFDEAVRFLRENQ